MIDTHTSLSLYATILVSAHSISGFGALSWKELSEKLAEKLAVARTSHLGPRDGDLGVANLVNENEVPH